MCGKYLKRDDALKIKLTTFQLMLKMKCTHLIFNSKCNGRYKN